MVGESPQDGAVGDFGGEDLIDGGAIQVARGELREAGAVGIGEAEHHLVGPAGLIQGSVWAGDVDGTGGIGKQTGSVVDVGFSSVHGAVSGVVNRFADAASECIVLVLHRFCHHVCGRFEGDGRQLVGVVPRVFGFGSGADVGFGCLVAFQIVSVSRYSHFRFHVAATFCRPSPCANVVLVDLN